MFRRARDFAIVAHGKQLYGEHPYVVHLDTVAGLCASWFPNEPSLRVAAYLHDVVEDTSVTIEQLRDLFPKRVCDMVQAVTNESGNSRKERNTLTYPKIATTPGGVHLKLSDRVANVEECWRTKDRKLFMYYREYKGFRDALWRVDDPQALALWRRLDELLGWYAR